MSQAGILSIADSGGGSVIETITGNTGGAQGPIASNFNITTDSSTAIFTSSPGNDILDFGITNLLLGSEGPAITSAVSNVSVGLTALDSLTTGQKNCAIGEGCLAAITSGIQNVGIGFESANTATTGFNLSALGHSALFNCGTAIHDCLGVGTNSLEGCTGNYNVGVGSQSMTAGVSGQGNTGIGGFTVLNLLTSGSFNTCIGYNAAAFLVSGSNNVILGENAGNNYTGAETNNILLNHAGVLGESTTTRIGTQGTQTAAFMAGVTGMTVSNLNVVTIDSTTGQLGSQATVPYLTWSDQSGAFNAAASNGYFITATSTATLPASPSEGATVAFIVDTTNVLTIQASGSQVIKIGTDVSVAGGTAVTTNLIRGNAVELIYRSTGTAWISLSSTGTYTVT